MNYTTIEQSKKLLELGLNPETADACYDVGYGQTKAHIECENFIDYFTNDEFPELKDRYIPCWSLGALLELMPIITKDIDEYLPYLIKGSEIWKGKRRAFWYCTYALLDDSNVELQTFNEGTPIEACYNMIVWLLQNNYIKTE